MFRRLFGSKLEINLISCGDAGQEIGAEMINTLKEYGADISSILFNSQIEKNEITKKFKKRVLIQSENYGFAKKIDEAITEAENMREEITKILKNVIPGDEDALMFITTGPGGTGLGTTLVVLDILYKEYKKIPPIISLLPETFENSRVQYNVSKFLYDVIFKDNVRGHSVILLDNKPAFDEMDLPFNKLARNRIRLIPTAIADLFHASFQDAIDDEFDASVSDLLDVIHTPGISVFVSEDLRGTTESDTSRIQDVMIDSVIATTSLKRDDIYKAKNAFISIIDADKAGDKLSFQTEFEARRLFVEFKGSRPYVKFISTSEKGKNNPKLRAILAGLPVPPRILQIMRLARDGRKRVIIEEHKINKQVIPLEIEKIKELEERLRS